MAFNRLNSEIILGSKVYISKIGATAGGSSAQMTVSDTAHPELPTSYDQPGDWIPLGKIRTSKVDMAMTSKDVEGTADHGCYVLTELKIPGKVRVTFSTNDITPEAYQLCFGLKNELKDGEPQAAFASGSNTIEAWLCYELTDAYRAKTNIAQIVARVRLSLANPLEAKSDPAQADYDALVLHNPLNLFHPAADVAES